MSKKDSIFNLKNTSIKKLINKTFSPVKFLIMFLIAAKKLISLVSAGGVGKTQIAMQLAFSIMTGEPFLGYFEVRQTGTVLIICTEETKRELVARLKIILNHHLCKIEDEEFRRTEKKRLKKLLKEHTRISYVGADESFCLSPDDQIPTSSTRVKKFCNEKLATPPKLIIIDNQSQLMLGEHNSTSAAALYMKKCVAICSETSAAVLNLAHTNKSSEGNDLEARLSAQSMLGSASFINIPRIIITMARLKATDKVEIPDSVDMADVIALKVSKSNVANTLKETIFLKRCPDGVLELMSVRELAPEQEFVEVANIIQNNAGINQKALRNEIMKELAKSKTGAMNLLQRACESKFVIPGKGKKNNACTYSIDQDKLNELIATIETRSSQINITVKKPE